MDVRLDDSPEFAPGDPIGTEASAHGARGGESSDVDIGSDTNGASVISSFGNLTVRLPRGWSLGVSFTAFRTVSGSGVMDGGVCKLWGESGA